MLGHSYLVAKNTGVQLFRAKKYWGTAIYSQKILEQNYLVPQNTGVQLFRAKKYLGTAI